MSESGGLHPALKALAKKGNRDGRIRRGELPAKRLRFFEGTDLRSWESIYSK